MHARSECEVHDSKRGTAFVLSPAAQSGRVETSRHFGWYPTLQAQRRFSRRRFHVWIAHIQCLLSASACRWDGKQLSRRERLSESRTEECRCRWGARKSCPRPSQISDTSQKLHEISDISKPAMLCSSSATGCNIYQFQPCTSSTRQTHLRPFTVCFCLV